MDLDTIKGIVTSPDFDGVRALAEHHDKLLENKEKFEGFKKRIVKDNEKKYGEEIRVKYGNDAVDGSSRKVLNMTQEEYEKAENLAKEIKETLAKALKIGDPAGEFAQKAVDLHRQWLCMFYDGYSKEYHAGLADMYVADERFKACYDAEQPGTAEFFRDAIRIYTGIR